MMRALANTTAAELIKLRGLPAVRAATVGTAAAAVALAAAVASSSAEATDASQAMLETIQFLQIGPILIGVLAVATEYQGPQIRTTVTATPDRLLMLAGKALAYLVTATITSVIAVGAGLTTAEVTLAVRDAEPAGQIDVWPVVGAAGYLVLIGLLGFALTNLLRCQLPPLVTMLGLVLIASPLVSGYGEARWLPDRAGSLLYLPGADSVLTPGTGALVLLAWIAAAASASILGLLTRDT